MNKKAIKYSKATFYCILLTSLQGHSFHPPLPSFYCVQQKAIEVFPLVIVTGVRDHLNGDIAPWCKNSVNRTSIAKTVSLKVIYCNIIEEREPIEVTCTTDKRDEGVDDPIVVKLDLTGLSNDPFLLFAVQVVSKVG